MTEYLERLPAWREHERWLVRHEGVLAEAHVYTDEDPSFDDWAEVLHRLRGFAHPRLSPVIAIEGPVERKVVITGDERGADIAALAVSEVCAGLAGIAEALAALQDRWPGHAHEKLDPRELFVASTGALRLRVPLWRLAFTAAASRLPTARDVAWTAPELLHSDGATPTSDVYGLALVAYVHAAGAHPFLRAGVNDTVLAIRTAPLPPLTAWPALANLLGRALDRAPARRPGLRAFAAGLREAVLP